MPRDIGAGLPVDDMMELITEHLTDLHEMAEKAVVAEADATNEQDGSAPFPDAAQSPDSN
jgi:hypothetical protein